jgi:hypothetical protein
MGKRKITLRWIKEEIPMLLRVKLAATELLANPKARAAFVLAMLVIATLVGGAPYDHGGGGG